MPKILIADATEEFRTKLCSLLSAEHTVYSTADGEQAFVLTQTLRPDLLIVDICLPTLDGITLLERLYHEGCRSAVLVMGTYFSQYAADALSKLQIDYVMSKPCPVEVAAQRAKDLLEHSLEENRKLRTTAAALLAPFGIPLRLRGYKYLLDGFVLMVKKPSQYLTKELYPAIAHKYGINDGQIERCIRNAIKQGIRVGNKNVWILHFGADSRGEPNKPSSGDMLELMLELKDHKLG